MKQQDHPSWRLVSRAGDVTSRGEYKGGGGIHIKPSHKGRLHKDTGTPSGEHISSSKLSSAKHSSDPAVRKRATFAINAKSWNKG